LQVRHDVAVGSLLTQFGKLGMTCRSDAKRGVVLAAGDLDVLRSARKRAPSSCHETTCQVWFDLPRSSLGSADQAAVERGYDDGLIILRFVDRALPLANMVGDPSGTASH
jgi:hypothetical protein